MPHQAPRWRSKKATAPPRSTRDSGALSDAADIEETLRTSAQVQDEDGHICESVQRGIASLAYETGRYAPRLEHGAYAFHGWVAAATERSESPVRARS